MATNGLGLEITELRLGLPGSGGVTRAEEKTEKKRVFAQIEGDDHAQKSKSSNVGAKSQLSATNPVVGWPPVCSYRRKNGFNSEESTKMYVKVSMDGAPFLRKINLSAQKDYSDLEMNLEKLFGSCFGVVELEGKSSEYVPIYEDKDGDWMLVGDVPWAMFVESCKKLRIMKRTEANGIGLRSAKGSFKRSASSQDG